MSLYTVRKCCINAARGVILVSSLYLEILILILILPFLLCILCNQELRISFLHDFWCKTLFIPDWSLKIGQELR